MPYFSKKLVAILSSLLFVTILIVGISFYSYNKLHEKELPQVGTQNAPLNQEIITKNDESLDVFSKEKTYENQQEYIAELNTTLDKSDLDENTRNALLLRKAIVLSTLRGSADESANGRRESIGIFKDLIDTPVIDDFSEYVKSFALVALASVEAQCCDNIRPIAQDFPELFNKHTAAGNSAAIARFLTIHDLLDQVSKSFKDDTSYVFQDIFISAMTLDLFGTQLASDERLYIFSKLENDIKYVDTNSLKNRLFTDTDNTKILPALYYAYGFDIYKSYEAGGVLLPETNILIDKNYELAFRVLEGEQKNATDGVSLELKILYNTARYLRSMEKRYGDALDVNKFTSLLDNALRVAQSNPEIKAVSDTLFIEGSRSYNTSLAYIVWLGRTYPSAKEYMESIGIKY